MLIFGGVDPLLFFWLRNPYRVLSVSSHLQPAGFVVAVTMLRAVTREGARFCWALKKPNETKKNLEIPDHFQHLSDWQFFEKIILWMKMINLPALLIEWLANVAILWATRENTERTTFCWKTCWPKNPPRCLKNHEAGGSKSEDTILLRPICILLYIYIYTWNINDHCFDSKRPCFGRLIFKNRGHLGSRYRYRLLCILKNVHPPIWVN